MQYLKVTFLMLEKSRKNKYNEQLLSAYCISDTILSPLFYFSLIKTGSQYVAQAGFQLPVQAILPLPPPKALRLQG